MCAGWLANVNLIHSNIYKESESGSHYAPRSSAKQMRFFSRGKHDQFLISGCGVPVPWMSASLPSARQHPSFGDCLEVKS